MVGHCHVIVPCARWRLHSCVLMRRSTVARPSVRRDTQPRWNMLISTSAIVRAVGWSNTRHAAPCVELLREEKFQKEQQECASADGLAPCEETQQGKDVIDQPAKMLSVIECGPSFRHVHVALFRQWFDQETPVHSPCTLVFVVDAFSVPWRERLRRTNSSMQGHQIFIGADGRVSGVRGFFREARHVFHGGHTLGPSLWDAPWLVL